MEELLQWIEYIEDIRQKRKVRHSLKDIVVIVLFATLANADNWVEIAAFAEMYQDYLCNYIELKNGPPSHDTISRVMGLVSSELLQQVYGKWQELLDRIQVKGQIITIDAMGTQTKIAEKIRSKRADYVLVLKKNQGTLYGDVMDYFSDREFQAGIKASGNYMVTIEKARSQTEKREYYQTEDIRWLGQRKEWKGLKSIGMEKKTIEKEGKRKEEYRYFISSLENDTGTLSRAVRGHWSIESMHWHLDVTFREDANTIINKTAAQNQNIIRKRNLGILKMTELSLKNKRLSMRTKRFVIGLAPIRFLEEVLNS